MSFRKPEHEIDHMFLERWSPRAYSSEPIDEEVLLKLILKLQNGRLPAIMNSLGDLFMQQRKRI